MTGEARYTDADLREAVRRAFDAGWHEREAYKGDLGLGAKLHLDSAREFYLERTLKAPREQKTKGSKPVAWRVLAQDRGGDWNPTSLEHDEATAQGNVEFLRNIMGYTARVEPLYTKDALLGEIPTPVSSNDCRTQDCRTRGA